MYVASPITTVEIPLSVNGQSQIMQGHVRTTQSTTPPDVIEYLKCMGWERSVNSNADYWIRRENTPYGYFTWEQAVVYCMVKPFLEKQTT